MSDQQVFLSLLGGIMVGLAGGLLVIPIMVLAHANDGGDDIGWGLLWFLLMAASEVVGLVLTATWARKRYGDFQA
jgi:hypothetical protein